MTDDDSAAKSDTETPQLPCKMVKEVEQVIEEKTGRKKKESICNTIEAIQIVKVATSKGEDQVMESPPLSEPNCLGDGPSGSEKLMREGRKQQLIN